MHAVVALVVLFAAAQLIRPRRANPPIEAKLSPHDLEMICAASQMAEGGPSK